MPFQSTGRSLPVAWLAGVAIAMMVCAPIPARAADEPSQTQGNPPADAQNTIDFLFGQPHGWVSFGGTWVSPRASGDLFRFVSDQLTIDASDFRAGAVNFAVGVSVIPQLDIVGDVEISRHAIGSEYRAYVKADRTPIAQTSRLDQSTVGIGVRYSPLGRGRTISRYAFIPRRVTPWVGAGTSIVYSTFLQQGEFVDFVDLSIFRHTFRSNGWSVGPHIDGGADVQVWRMVFLNLSARYAWVRSSLDADFVGFEGLDLAGFRGSTGIAVVF